MQFHVAFDTDSDFEVNQEVTQKFISKVVKTAALNFLRNPETLAELTTGASTLVMLIENPNDNILDALSNSPRFRLYDTEQLLKTEEETDEIDFEIANRVRDTIVMKNGSKDEQFKDAFFAVYAIIVNSTYEQMSEDSNNDEDTTSVVLEQVIFFKPKDFVLNLLGSSTKVLDEHLENFLNNIPHETVESTIEELIESK